MTGCHSQVVARSNQIDSTKELFIKIMICTNVDLVVKYNFLEDITSLID